MAKVDMFKAAVKSVLPTAKKTASSVAQKPANNGIKMAKPLVNDVFVAAKKAAK